MFFPPMPGYLMNTQPIEAKDQSDGMTLDVIDVWITIQGEGPYVGMPAVFVRLAGCNLACPACDTQYTDGRKVIGINRLCDMVVAEAQDRANLVVLTGGEPMRQKLSPLIELLYRNYLNVQIETNGTYFQSVRALIVCSPKTPVIHSELIPLIHSFKYVVEAGYINKLDGLPIRVLGKDCVVARPPKNFPRDRIYIQPADMGDPETNQQNMQQAVDVCLTFGYRLCLQMHKIAGLK